MKKLIIVLVLFGFTQSAFAAWDPFVWGDKHMGGHSKLRVPNR